MHERDPKADVHAIAYEHAVRSIDQQADQLEQLRGRLGSLVSMSSISASLLVGIALSGGRATHLGGLGVAALIVAGVALLWISVTAVLLWWPTRGTYRLDPAIIIREWGDSEPAATRSEVERDLALYMGRHWDRNAWSIDRRHRWYSAALVAFLIELLALGTALWDVTR